MSQITPILHDGSMAIIKPKRKRNRNFWKEIDGERCIVVSCYRKSAIVEVPSRKELRICRITDLLPILLS
jgi:hypothetical protein